MQQKLTEIKGIGPAAAEKLREHGISNVLDLSNTNAKELVKIQGIGSTSANRWIEAAKTLVNSPNKNQNEKGEKVKEKPKTKMSKIDQLISKVSDSSENESSSPLSNNKKKSKPSLGSDGENVPRFLLERMSRKASKIMEMSSNTLKNEDLKDLKKYQQILTPEKIKFNPSFQDEKKIIDSIEEKSKFIEELILDYNYNRAKLFLKEYVVNPLEKGEFREIFNTNGKEFDAEKFAIQIYDEFGRRVKKEYPFTEIACIRDIEKVLEKMHSKNKI